MTGGMVAYRLGGAPRGAPPFFVPGGLEDVFVKKMLPTAMIFCIFA